MRVTDKILQNNLLSNLSSISERLSDAETVVLTHKKINKPSDDPVGTLSALSIRSKLNEITQYQRNIDSAQSLLQSTESAASDIIDLIEQVNSLAVQGASDNYSDEDKASISYEVNEVLEQLYGISNSSINAQYIFAGTDNDSAPYQAIRSDSGEITSVKTTGTSGDIYCVIGENLKLKININGEDVFEKGVNLFDLLVSVRDNLRSADTDGLQENLTQLSSATEQVTTIESIIGSRVNRVEAAENRASDDELNFTEYLSNTENADSAEAILQYQQVLVTLQSALQAGVRILTPKLSDYLQ